MHISSDFNKIAELH